MTNFESRQATPKLKHRTFPRPRNRLKAGVAFLLLSPLFLAAPCKGGSGNFETTGDLNAARYSHSATSLLDGRVLVVGGTDFPADMTTTAELYDPANGSWTYTGGVVGLRWAHSATLLANGRVLVAGGFIGLISATETAELYDPTTEAWTPTGSLHGPRLGHSATLLPNGKVLVAGGFGEDPYTGPFPVATAELYDPTTGVWATTGSMTTERGGQTATLLPSGAVLVAGGRNSSTLLSSAELYDPDTETWMATDSMVVARQSHTATSLLNGMVVVAGGDDGDGSSAELYDSENQTWTTTGNLNVGRSNHTATLLPNGTVLVVGGTNTQGFLASAEIYHPDSGTWTITGSLVTARDAHTATLLPDSTVLVAGGTNDSGYPATALASAELYVVSPSLLNISTRLDVQNGDNVMIGGFIVTGTESQTVVVRGLGPSLGVSGSLSDPMIELHDSTGALIATNDNWKDDPNQQQVVNGGLTPPNELESALWKVLDPGAYTVILKGKNDGTGVGLVEVYQVGQGADAKLANISTRGLVQTDNNVLIGGVIVGAGTGDGTANVLIRALGPSVPVAGVLSDPTLELHDGSGALIDSNDDWKTRPDGTSQQAEIEATTIPPNNDLESALLETLSPGNYTAIVRGKDNTLGVGMVEVYNLPSGF